MTNGRLRLLGLLLAVASTVSAENIRPPKDDADRRAWLENMVWHHRFTTAEIKAATGLPESEIETAVKSLGPKPKHPSGGPLLVLPYPGGRHPRIGFLEGAIDPQRETKLSVFTPWDDSSYVVADIPEAIWSNLGLTYLAHTHIPTIWDTARVQLPPLEWSRLENGDYKMERTLPNGIRFGTLARPTPQALLFKSWLSNGTDKALSDLRVQNCIMLKAAPGFNVQTNANKVMRGVFAACRSDSGDRWVITACQPLHRAWANAPVPCLHSDPRFPDTAPGKTSTLYGLVSFYTGKEIEAEFRRLEANWESWMRF